MLIFHEGLPGSGKSYSACVDHILPALTQGRRVFASIAGLNHQAFAELAEISLEECKELLIQLSPDQINAENLPKLWAKYPSGQMVTSDYNGEIQGSLLQDSLMVIDEIQNIFPSTRQKLPEDVLQFIAEHRHYGMDIIIMSQAFSSVHKDWRVRVQRKYSFAKMTAVGRPNRYKWEAYEAHTPEKFQKISGGNKPYVDKFFGLYSSHTGGTKNTAVLEDDRINIFKGFGFRVGLPGMVFLVFVACFYLWKFFHPQKPEAPKTVEAKTEAPKREAPAVQPSPAPAPPSAPVQVQQKPVEPPPLDEFDVAAKSSRLRYSGYAKGPDFEYALIEAFDKMGHVNERFRSDQLQAMGWQVKVHAWGVVVTQGQSRHIARQWPKERIGMVPNESRNDLSGQ